MTTTRPVTVADLRATLRAQEQTETRRAAEIVRFLQRQRGVTRAQARLPADPAASRALQILVWTETGPSGLPQGTLPDGTRVSELNRYETEYLYQEIFVDRVYQPRSLELPERALILDVGANIGLFSLFQARRLPGARLVALEPSPDAFAALSANVRRHGLPVVCLPHALGPSSGRQRLTVYPAASVFSGLDAVAAADRAALRAAITAAVADPGSGAVAEEIAASRMEGAYQPEVTVWSLPDLLARLGGNRVDLLKLDTEGNELGILGALAPDDWARIDRLLLEIHHPEETEPLRTLLQAAGFVVETYALPALQGTGFSNLYAQRRDLVAGGGASAGLDLVSEPPLDAEQRLWLALTSRPGQEGSPGPITLEILPELPSQPRPAIAARVELPRETVDFICGLWKELLGTEVSPGDDFFACGGTSLAAVRMLSRVRTRFDRELRFEDFLADPTVQGLASHLTTPNPSSSQGGPS